MTPQQKHRLFLSQPERWLRTPRHLTREVSPPHAFYAREIIISLHVVSSPGQGLQRAETMPQKNSLCINCFGKHAVSQCPSKKSCVSCGRRHHSTIHETFLRSPAIMHRTAQPAGSSPAGSASTGPSTLSSQKPEERPATQNASVTSLHLRNYVTGRVSVLLATARVIITNKYNKKIIVRALIDPGSEVSIISEALVEKLHLPRKSDTTTIFGIGGDKTCYARGRVNFNLKFCVNQEFCVKISALILPRVTVNTQRVINNNESWPHLQGLVLADPDFSSNDPIDLILGAEVHAIIIENGLRKGTAKMPVALKTALGWILSGSTGEIQSAAFVSINHCQSQENIIELVSRFWQQEELPLKSIPLTDADRKCEEYFTKTTQRLPSGRYMVRLPFAKQGPEFANSRPSSINIFSKLEKRLSSQPHLRFQYNQFLHEYKMLGHMSKTTLPTSDKHYYLPHHGVFKDNDPKSKLRVVFNASARFKN
ncbi:uncharacterized protein [Cardiocondyla obscurior]|uniref:uncharacterized protein n=1 Tax=Cardiocondyla obscurior TaxID=286306 RepID=UPI00396579F5